MSWKGTAVPNSGVVENVYFNTNLSDEEVRNFLSQLTYNEEENANVLLQTIGETNQIAVIMGGAVICDLINEIYYWIDPMINSEEEPTPFVGWNPEFNGVIDINNELQSSVTDDNGGTFINGSENDKLSSLFSITPFEEVQEEVTLDSWAEGIADAIREKKSTTDKIPRLNFAQEIRSIETGSGELLEPTAVPISGMVEKVYFNFNIDVEKMCGIIAGLSYVEVPDVGLTYPIISNADMTSSLVIIKRETGDYPNYILVARLGSEVKDIAIFESSTSADPTDVIYLLEHHDLSQPIEFKFENVVSQLVTQFPTYVNSNELLKEMISITPIQKVEGGSGKTKYLPLVSEFLCSNVDVTSMATTVTDITFEDNCPELYSCDISVNMSTGEITRITQIEKTTSRPQMAYKCHYFPVAFPTVTYLLISDLDMSTFTAKMYFFKLDDIEKDSSNELMNNYIVTIIPFIKEDASLNIEILQMRLKKPLLGDNLILGHNGSSSTSNSTAALGLSYSTFNQFGIIEQ